MRLLAVLLIASLPAYASASDGGSPLPNGRDLSGEWAIPGPFGEREPAAGPLVREDTCLNGVTFWRIAQKDGSVESEVVEGYHRRGARPASTSAESERAQGTYAKGELLLKGAITQTSRRFDSSSSPKVTYQPVEYRLTFEPKTGHLVGTRNGKPFWAAPLIHRPLREACDAPPP